MINLSEFFSWMDWDYEVITGEGRLENQYLSSIAMGLKDVKAPERESHIDKKESYAPSHATIVSIEEIDDIVVKAKKGSISGMFFILSGKGNMDLPSKIKTYIRKWSKSLVVLIKSNISAQELYDKLNQEIHREMIYIKELMDTHYIQLVHLLTQDANISEIEKKAYTILDNPMVITDESYKVLAYSQDIKIDDPIWLTIVNNDHCPFSIVEMTDYNQFWKRLNAAGRPLFVDSQDFLPYIKRAVAQVNSDGKIRGYIALLEINKKISSRDLQILQMVAELVGSILSRKDAVSKAKGQLEPVLIHDLFYGKMTKETMAQNRAKSLGWDLTKHYGVLCIEGFKKKNAALENKLEYIKERLKTQFPLCVYSLDDNKALFIIGINDKEKWRNILRKNLEEFMSNEGLTCSVGLLVDQLIDIIKSYNQAKNTSTILPFISGEMARRSVYIYSEVAIYTLLMNWLQDKNSTNLSSPALQALKEIDETEGSEYVFTLRIFFENNQSVGATAQAMFLHRNTINYRLNKIRDLIEDDFDNPLVRLHLYLSLLIQDIQ